MFVWLHLLSGNDCDLETIVETSVLRNTITLQKHPGFTTIICSVSREIIFYFVYIDAHKIPYLFLMNCSFLTHLCPNFYFLNFKFSFSWVVCVIKSNLPINYFYDSLIASWDTGMGHKWPNGHSHSQIFPFWTKKNYLKHRFILMHSNIWWPQKYLGLYLLTP